MNALEPANIKQREELMNQAKKDKEKKPTSLNEQDFVNPPNSVMSGSMSTINPAPSLSSMGSQGRHISRPQAKTKRRASHNGVKHTTDILAEAEESIPSVRVVPPINSKNRLAPPNQPETVEHMTPINEFDESNKQERAKDTEEHMKSYHNMHKQKDMQRQSHPACKGPDFVRSVFNVQGQSPLVAHFLQSKHLQPDAGQIVYVQRTQMENLPPLDAPTYRDVMKESYRTVRDIDRKYQILAEKGAKETTAFQKRQKDMLRDYHHKEQSLLSQQREVKRLSDLIMLELRKDEDSITAGAAQALELALDAQD